MIVRCRDKFYCWVGFSRSLDLSFGFDLLIKMVKFYDVSFLQTNVCGCSYSIAAMSFQVMKYCAIDEIKRESGLNRGDEWVGNGKKIGKGRLKKVTAQSV
jgi:hypothetical protein